MEQILSWGTRTFIMGILNMTPDSFSGDGMLTGAEPVSVALERARQFVHEGADILDVGGESTRPGSQPISAGEELDRVIPLIKVLAEARLTRQDGQPVILSIDTYKANVAEEALKVGINWVNDVWGLRADAGMAEVVARYAAGLVLMDNRSRLEHVELQSRLGGRYIGAAYRNLIGEVKADLTESIQLARKAGIEDWQIILDPGIGFGKTVEQNLELLDRLGEICGLNFPILIAPTRKGFIGYTLNLPREERLDGTAAAVAVGIVRGADIIRVHDVAVMARVARMTDAIVRRGTLNRNPLDKPRRNG